MSLKGRCLSGYTVGSPQEVEFGLGGALFSHKMVFIQMHLQN